VGFRSASLKPPERPTVAESPQSASVGSALALAIVTGSITPLLLMDEALTVLAASASFHAAFGGQVGEAVGQNFFEIGAGKWARPQLRMLLRATISGSAEIAAYEMRLATPGADDRTVLVNAKRVEGEDGVRLLLTLTDVTEARVAARVTDELLHEKSIMLQEIQHRVANSLQIIASVLLQSARKVDSEESRLHLRDAHNRVMSMATAQQHLAGVQLGDVELGAYFEELCGSLGASMIRDHEQQSIVVDTDDSRVKPEVSISLGLIVTELVINALKHAFPDGRPGRIQVGYHAKGPNWVLSVADNGVGMPADPKDIRQGLGSSLVDALARQLHAKVHVVDARPGVAVSVVHNHIAVVTAEAV
jgi:two-component sensor histidine kinase